mmetsp:Transcript_59924/g.136938  ORF Transcript_59924/g.136938 Transcript_59924/m.136938 type:complete len:266 (+) Transcript_59924:1588-2385(+)
MRPEFAPRTTARSTTLPAVVSAAESSLNLYIRSADAVERAEMCALSTVSRWRRSTSGTRRSLHQSMRRVSSGEGSECVERRARGAGLYGAGAASCTSILSCTRCAGAGVSHILTILCTGAKGLAATTGSAAGGLGGALPKADMRDSKSAALATSLSPITGLGTSGATLGGALPKAAMRDSKSAVLATSLSPITGLGGATGAALGGALPKAAMRNAKSSALATWFVGLTGAGAGAGGANTLRRVALWEEMDLMNEMRSAPDMLFLV